MENLLLLKKNQFLDFKTSSNYNYNYYQNISCETKSEKKTVSILMTGKKYNNAIFPWKNWKNY